MRYSNIECHYKQINDYLKNYYGQNIIKFLLTYINLRNYFKKSNRSLLTVYLYIKLSITKFLLNTI